MKYLKKSVNQFLEGKNTLKKGQPIYPFVNLNIDDGGNRIGMFYDKLMIDENTDDEFEEFILTYLTTVIPIEHIIGEDTVITGSQISTNYVTRQQLKRIKGIQNLSYFIQQIRNISSNNLDFAKYFPNLKHFVFLDDSFETKHNYIFKHNLKYISTISQNNNLISKTNHKVKLNPHNKQIKSHSQITYKNNIYNIENLYSNFLCGLKNENLKIKTKTIYELQNTGNPFTIRNLTIYCEKMKPLAFCESNIQSIKIVFAPFYINDNPKLDPTIRNSSFYRCKNLNKVVLDNVNKIQFGAFSHCYNLEKIYIHSDSRVFLSSYCFYCCYNLTDIYFDYIPRFSIGIGCSQAHSDDIYPEVLLHGVFINHVTGGHDDEPVIPDYEYDYESREHINIYCSFLYKIFNGCLRGHDLNIHIKHKSDTHNEYSNFKFIITKLNEYISESNSINIGKINII